jgi:hypothetical protein
MKNILFLVWAIILFCNFKDTNLNSENITSINGQINNWNMGSKVTIWFDTISSNIDTNGFFNIKQLTTPIKLKPIDSIFSGRLNISNHNVKASECCIEFRQESNYHHAYSFGIIQLSNKDKSIPQISEVGDYFVSYYYVSDDVDVQGENVLKYFNESMNYRIYDETLNYYIINTIHISLKLKKGWNRVLCKTHSVTKSTIETYYSTSPIPSDAKYSFQYDRK